MPRRDYRDPHYTILYEEKETVEGPESVGLTRKLEQVYGLILEDDDDDDDGIYYVKKVLQS